MSQKPADYGREVRDTIVKSGLTGVAATVLAVTIFSPAGLGGMVGTSLASGFGLDPNSASSDPYANLPPYPAPLTQAELNTINGELARTTASLEITRAATDGKIEHLRTIALSGAAVTYTPMPHTPQIGAGLRLTVTEPVMLAAPAAPPAPAPAVEATPANAVGGVDPSYRDPHLELAELLLAHETF
jgi:hypothetical protein